MTHQEMETAIARLFEGQDLLTGKVTDLTKNVAGLTENVAELGNTVKVMRKEADADRKVVREAIAEMRSATGEMRTVAGTMLDIAESMAANVTLLTEAQQTTRKRVDNLETRVSRIEKRARPPKNGPKR